MHIVHVHVVVKSEYVPDFLDATLDNARNSLAEPGVVRFDVVQQDDDPSRFLLIEIYRDAEAAVAHKATDHYLRWREAVAAMMREPRTATRYSAVHVPVPE